MHYFILEKMLICPLPNDSPISLDPIQTALPPALEEIAAFVSREVLGLHLGTVWCKQYLS